MSRGFSLTTIKNFAKMRNEIDFKTYKGHKENPQRTS